MSIIGKKVEFYYKLRSYDDNHKKETGIVLDRFSDLVYSKHQVASGLGGTIDTNTYFNEDYYLIELKDGELIKTKCTNLIKTLTN